MKQYIVKTQVKKNNKIIAIAKMNEWEDVMHYVHQRAWKETESVNYFVSCDYGQTYEDYYDLEYIYCYC